MLCPACDAEIPNDSTFCPKCGKPVASAVPPVPVPEPTGPEKLKAKIEEVRNSPMDPEHDLWKGGFSPKAMLGYWVLAGVVTIVAVVAGLMLGNATFWIVALAIVFALWVAFALYLLYQRMSVEYQLTTQRLFHRTGILTRVTNRVECIDIDDVQFAQSFIERFLGVGTIRILSTDVSDPMLTLRGIDDVKNVADMIDKVRRDERRRRGLHIETV